MRRYSPGHFDGDGCTFPDPGHFAESAAPRITAVVVHVTCDPCALDDEFEFTPEDIAAGVEISTPCACNRRISVTAEASAHYLRGREALGVSPDGGAA